MSIMLSKVRKFNVLHDMRLLNINTIAEIFFIDARYYSIQIVWLKCSLLIPDISETVILLKFCCYYQMTEIFSQIEKICNSLLRMYPI